MADAVSVVFVESQFDGLDISNGVFQDDVLADYADFLYGMYRDARLGEVGDSVRGVRLDPRALYALSEVLERVQVAFISEFLFRSR